MKSVKAGQHRGIITRVWCCLLASEMSVTGPDPGTVAKYVESLFLHMGGHHWGLYKSARHFNIWLVVHIVLFV